MVGRKEMLHRLCAEYLADSGSSADHALSTLDWDYFLEVANYHGICPLLYYNLVKSNKHVPAKVLKHLREKYYLNTIRNELFYDELGQILEALRDANIEVIVLKGAVLAETIYQEKGLRPFSDIDLLIRKDSLNRAEKELIGLGYTLDICSTPRNFSERFDYHLRYIKGASIVELHWELGLRAGIYKYMKVKADTIWKDSRRSRIAGIDVLIPSPENLIIHSCIHSAKHKYSRLIWLYDIRQIAEYYRIDWGCLISIIKSDYIARPVFYGISFAEELFGPIMTKHMLDELRPPILEIRILKFFINRKSFSIFTMGKDTILCLLLIDRQIDRLRFLIMYPAEALTYLLFSSKKKTIRRLREGTVGL